MPGKRIVSRLVLSDLQARAKIPPLFSPFCFDDEIIGITLDNVVKEVSEYDGHGPPLISCVASAFLSPRGMTF